MPRKGKSTRAKNSLVVARAAGKGSGGETAKGRQVTFGDHESALELDSGDGCTT